MSSAGAAKRTRLAGSNLPAVIMIGYADSVAR